MCLFLASGSPLSDVTLSTLEVFSPFFRQAKANSTVFRQPLDRDTVFRRAPPTVKGAPSRLPGHVHEVAWPPLGLAFPPVRLNVLAGVLGASTVRHGRPNRNYE
jgi:hypothetical protein